MAGIDYSEIIMIYFHDIKVFILGCVHSRTMNEASVISMARQVAEKAGYILSDYNRHLS